MAKQVINVGTVANDGTGDPLRTAMIKAKENFDELYDEIHFKGKYTTLALLESAYPSGEDGDYAIVDAGSGSIAMRYFWDEEEGWLTESELAFNRQTASYELVLSDRNKIVEMNVAGANNLTVPLNSSIAFPVGTQILISQYGAGQTTIVATGGVTIRSKDGNLKLTDQYSAATLVKIATNEWYLFGDLTA